jgi:hypothetical protein
MKFLAAALLALSLPGSHIAAPRNVTAAVSQSQPQPRKGGMWYMADTGHAVYCSGPVVMLSEPNGELQRVATLCQGEKPVVPLKD